MFMYYVVIERRDEDCCIGGDGSSAFFVKECKTQDDALKLIKEYGYKNEHNDDGSIHTVVKVIEGKEIVPRKKTVVREWEL